MNKFFDDFMQAHKAILELKRTHRIKRNKKDMIKNVLFSILLITVVFGAMGLLLNTLENLNYVFYMTSTVVLGSFVLYRVSEEMMFKNTHNLDYKIVHSLSYDIISLAAIIIVTNSLLFTLFLRIAIPSLDLIVLGVLSVLLLLVMMKLNSYLEPYKNNSVVYVFRTSVVLMFLYVVLINLLGIGVLPLSYFVTTCILVVLYFERRYSGVDYFVLENMKTFLVVTVGVTLLIFLANIRMVNSEDRFSEIFKFGFVHNEMNVVDELTLSEGEIFEDLFGNKDFIFLETTTDVSIYNYELKMVHRIDKNEYPQIDNCYLHAEELACIKVNHESKSALQFLFDDNFERETKVLDYNLYSYREIDETFIVNNEIWEIEGRYVIVTKNNYVTEYTNNNYRETDLPDSVQYLDNDTIVYIRNNQRDIVNNVGAVFDVRDYYYDDGYILEKFDNAFGIYSSSEILKDEKELLFDTVCEDCIIGEFHQFEDLFFIEFRQGATAYLSVYNKNGVLVDQFDLVWKNLYYTEDFLIIQNFDKGTLEVVDYANTGIDYVESKSAVYDQMFYLSILLSVVVIEISVPSFRRGYEHV